MIENTSPNKEFELICVIVNFGAASKIIKYAKQFGAKGGTVFLGKGTVKKPILEFLELTEVRKEIVLMAAEKTTADIIMNELNKKFDFKRPNHGIAFSISIKSIIGTNGVTSIDTQESRGVENSMYNIIYTVVDKGKAEDVIDAAAKAGSKGGTIINARGSGIHETSKLFSMEIEPEKEVVLIISEKHLTDAITSSIKDKLQVEKPGNGIVFVQEVNKAFGLV